MDRRLDIFWDVQMIKASPIYFSNSRDDVHEWKGSLDYMTPILIPRRWWSWRDWVLSWQVRPLVRWHLETPPPRFVMTHKQRVSE